MATCSHRCQADLGEPIKTDEERKYYACKACGHRVSTGRTDWCSHGHEPFSFEAVQVGEFDFGIDDFDFGF